MRKILIPTDFTVESLQLIEYVVLNFPDTKLDIKFVAGYRLPDTRWGIAHFQEKEQIRKNFSSKFKETQRRILLEYKNNIEAISFELFTGVNSLAFQNFLEKINVEDAVVPEQKVLYCKDSKWFDTTKLIKKNVKKVIEVPVKFSEETTQKKFSLTKILNL